MYYLYEGELIGSEKKIWNVQIIWVEILKRLVVCNCET